MVKKKNKRTKRASRGGPIFVSPDGGETVYEQKRSGGWGRCVHKSEQAKLMDQAQAEMDIQEKKPVYLLKTRSLPSYRVKPRSAVKQPKNLLKPIAQINQQKKKLKAK